MVVQKVDSMAAAEAIAHPRHIWRNGDDIFVFTEVDIPAPLSQIADYSGVLNVKKFGAKGDGRDDTKAVKSALNELQPGGKLLFPNGVYDIYDELLLNTAGVSIIGESKNSTQIVKRFEGGSLLRYKNAPYWGLSNVMLQGASESSGLGNLLHIEGSSYGRASDSRLLNANGSCIRIEQGGGITGAYFNVLDGLHTYNGQVGNIYCGLESSETKIIGGEHSASKGFGWVIEGGNGHSGIGASFEGSNVGGVSVGTSLIASEVNLFGCRFEGAGKSLYGVQVANVNSILGVFGCHMTSCVVADVFDPDHAMVTFIQPNRSSSPSSISGLKVHGDNHYLGALNVLNQSGVWGIRGPSTTRVESLTNSIELRPNSGLVSHGIAGGIYDFAGGDGKILANGGSGRLRLQVGGEGAVSIEGGPLEVASSWDSLNLLKLGTRYLWFDTEGRLRTKSGRPSSEYDGITVASQP